MGEGQTFANIHRILKKKLGIDWKSWNIFSQTIYGLLQNTAVKIWNMVRRCRISGEEGKLFNFGASKFNFAAFLVNNTISLPSRISYNIRQKPTKSPLWLISCEVWTFPCFPTFPLYGDIIHLAEDIISLSSIPLCRIYSDEWWFVVSQPYLSANSALRVLPRVEWGLSNWAPKCLIRQAKPNFYSHKITGPIKTPKDKFPVSLWTWWICRTKFNT